MIQCKKGEGIKLNSLTKLTNECKKYKLDDTLHKIGEYTREMIKKSNGITSILWHRKIGSYYQEGYMYITPWCLNGLVYHAVCNSNDYKYKTMQTQDLFRLVSLYQNYDNDLSKIKMKDINKNDILLYMMFGHSQEQLWYQDKQKLLMQFNRNTEILLNVWKNIQSQIDINEIISEELNMDLITYNKTLAVLCLIGMNYTEVHEEYEDITINEDMKKNLKKVIEIYTIDYKDIRKNNNLKEKILFTKPIVKTDKGRLIITNSYLLLKLLSDGLYWIIRNHFYRERSQKFINDFGNAFEGYLSNVLSYYLDKNLYYHLQETNKHKIADWIIETQQCFVILEQKSALASLTIKKLHPNIKLVKNYIKKFNEAFDQLNATEKIYHNKTQNKKVVKLIVHYEDLPVQNILKEEVVKQRGHKNEDLNIFFINIYELERLIYTLNKDEDKFHQVIFKMIKISSEFTADSREFGQVMDELKIEKEDYLKNHNHLAKTIADVTGVIQQDI